MSSTGETGTGLSQRALLRALLGERAEEGAGQAGRPGRGLRAHYSPPTAGRGETDPAVPPSAHGAFMPELGLQVPKVRGQSGTSPEAARDGVEQRHAHAEQRALPGCRLHTAAPSPQAAAAPLPPPGEQTAGQAPRPHGPVATAGDSGLSPGRREPQPTSTWCFLLDPLGVSLALNFAVYLSALKSLYCWKHY